jgi:hypothetical protein
LSHNDNKNGRKHAVEGTTKSAAIELAIGASLAVDGGMTAD